MKKENRKNFWVAATLLVSFVVWTVLVCTVDVQLIGPEGTSVGVATLNGFVHRITGVHMWLYVITDWLGLVPLGIMAVFGVLGLTQWIKRKSILKVDYSILVLGIYYVIVFAVYLFFENFVINYRPVLINGNLEASYPSSTTMLALCVMPTALMQIKTRIKNKVLLRIMSVMLTGFTLFMVVGRLVSGVHWFTDIAGGVLCSLGLVIMYYSAVEIHK